MRKIILILFLVVISSCKKQEELKRDKIVIDIAKKEVLSRLKSPSTAVFIDSSNTLMKLKRKVGDTIDTYCAYIYVDAQNSYGAMLRNRYMVVYESLGADSLNPKNYRLRNFFD